jgi:O-antigen/teichoic acid export membrane protein
MGGALIISFFRNVIYGSAIGPEGIGYFTIVMTVSSYGVFLQLGLMSGLTRELPIAFGQGEIQKGKNLVGETTTAVLTIQSFLLIIYLLIISAISFEDNIKQNSFFLAGLVVIPAQLISLVMLRLRSEQKILTFSFLHFLNTFLTVLIGYLLLPFFGFKAAVWALIFINILFFIFASLRYLGPVNYFYFNIKDLLYLVKIGFPVMLAGLAVSFFITMDKIFLMRYSTLENLGIYQIASLPLILGVSIQSLANQYIGPKLLFEYGKGATLMDIYKNSFRTSLVILIMMIILSFPILFSLNLVITTWLPLFEEAIPLFKFFYIAAIFLATNLTDVIYSAANKPVHMFIQNLLLVILSLIIFFLISSQPIIWFAYAVIFLQFMKLLSSLVINLYFARTNK